MSNQNSLITKVKCIANGFMATLFLYAYPDMLEKCKGDLLEVKDAQTKTQPFLLENLVYFVEVSLSSFLRF